MVIADLIHDRVESLPEPAQTAVLDFVDFLLFKFKEEEAVWSQFSLTSALRGLEDEEWPEYGGDELTERWS